MCFGFCFSARFLCFPFYPDNMIPLCHDFYYQILRYSPMVQPTSSLAQRHSDNSPNSTKPGQSARMFLNHRSPTNVAPSPTGFRRREPLVGRSQSPRAPECLRRSDHNVCPNSKSYPGNKDSSQWLSGPFRVRSAKIVKTMFLLCLGHTSLCSI